MANDHRSFCFIHAADLHLDTPFKGMHEVAPFVAAALREASLAAFDEITELAIAREAAFIVFSGDIYDGAERGLRAQLRFRDGLARLSAAGIVSFVVHGNHDPVATGWSAISRWPDGVTVFGSDRVEVVEVERDGETIATVQGISYARRDTTENLALRYFRPDRPGIHVGVLHCNVQGAGDGYAQYSPCTLEDLRRSGLDYWALGHIHQHKVLARGSGPGDPTIVYAGNSQARSPRVSERGPKGAVVVHVEDGRVERVEPVACDLVRFDEIECPIADCGSIDELEEQLIEEGRLAHRRADGRALVLRARITGRGRLHDELARPGRVDGLLEHLRDGAGDAADFCWWDGLVNECAPEIDLDLLRGRGDFAADLLAVVDGIREQPTSLDAVRAALVASVPRSLAASFDDLLGDPPRLLAVLEAATTAALDGLEIGAGA
jgi:DNA repair exonuclease SbcCD nuclease subunit